MKYRVHMYAVLGYDTEIEAENQEEAEAKADELFYSEDICWDDFECGESGYEII